MHRKDDSKLRLGVLFILFFIGFSLIGQSQISAIRHYGVENGLSQNTVWCLQQDLRGFLWIGTKDGLNRFDGYNFKKYRCIPGDTTSIGNNFIRSIYARDSIFIWVGTDKGIYIYNSKTDTFRPFRKVSNDGTVIITGVNAIVEDLKGNIWVGSFGQGLFRYNPASDELIRYSADPQNPKSLGSNLVSSLLADSDGNIWVGTLQGGLNQYIENGMSFKRYQPGLNSDGINDSDIYSLCEAAPDQILVGTWLGGINILNRTTGKFESLVTGGDKSISHNTVRAILPMSPGFFLAGTENGLNILDLKTRLFTGYFFNPSNPYGISDNIIYSLTRDREGGFWIGTYFGGLDYFATKKTQFNRYYPGTTSGSLSGKAISEMVEDPKGNLWIATEDGGLNYFDRKTEQFARFKQGGPKGISYYNLHALLLDGDNLWIGMFVNGIDRINLKTGKLRRYRNIPGDSTSLKSDAVFSILKDSQGIIWLGTILGLNTYSSHDESFNLVSDFGLGSVYIYDMLEDSRGNVWFGSYDKGLYVKNLTSGKWSHFVNKEGDSTSLSMNKVISLHEDRKSRLWIGTEGGGLCLFDADHGNFHRFDETDGLPNNVIYKILDDSSDNLWISTNNGLVRFNPDNGMTKVYDQGDGLQSKQFNYRSGIETRDGEIFFGGINGLNSFYPDSLEENKFVPPVVLTQFEIGNQEVPIGKPDSPLKYSIDFTDHMALTHRQRTISFEFVSLSFRAPEKNRFAYFLEGVDDDWILSGNNRRLTYNSLQPGDYRLWVKASNNDGVWNPEGVSIDITILPPFWKSRAALIIYIAILFISLGLFSYQIVRMAEKRHRNKLEKFKVDREKEINRMKIEYFTRIAHEIRTPLTLIHGPLETLVRNPSKNITNKELAELKLMHKNTRRLLNLANQLLEFQKIDSLAYKIEYYLTDIIDLISDIVEHFEPLAKTKGLELKMSGNVIHCQAEVPAEALTKILSNLLSNAFKYAYRSVEVEILIEIPDPDKKDEIILSVKVKDDGEGIPRHEMDNIFKPFYQMIKDPQKRIIPGVGLGLALVKTLSDLIKGIIMVDTNVGGGAVFSVSIPLKTKKYQDSTNCSNIVSASIGGLVNLFMDEEQSGTAAGQEKLAIFHSNPRFSTILIVEDVTDLADFLRQNLIDRYNIITAENGQVALDHLSKNRVDLVISDILMPVLDGIQLCKTIKNDLRFSHIPVIFLTALSDDINRIKGLEYGADAYIEKPFSMEVLIAQIKNLLDNRIKLKVRFQHEPFSKAVEMAESHTDREFMSKLEKIVLENIQNNDFSVEDLARGLLMSKSNLYLKLRAISDVTPNDFIRIIRLKKAAELLASGDYKINEVCYLVGFNTPSYFSRCFQVQFGILPNEFISNLGFGIMG